jgi:predicted AAA+ superfamily ATPase
MEEELIARSSWLNKLRSFKDTNLIKVITGIRRCGKSSLMELFMGELMQSGIKSQNILCINFELMKYDSIKQYRDLYKFIMKNLPKKGKPYIFLDEVQHVAGWEKAVNSIRLETKADIYITGSNAWMLSSEIATLLSGRYVEINMLPLSFSEFLDFGKFPAPWTLEDKFNRYLSFGGFPGVPALPQNSEIVNDFLQGIYNTVIVKDVLSRHAIKDIKSFNQLVKFLLQNTGNIVSPSKIAGMLNNENKDKSLKAATISNYLDLLEKANIVYASYRYDIKGKELLKTLCKYYVIDTGLRNAILGSSNADMGAILETVVFFELKRRGFNVFTGKQYNSEVDFLAVSPTEKYYYQVTLSMLNETVKERELAPLMAIKDSYPKIILSMDKTFIPDYNGIKHKYILDFLMDLDVKSETVKNP